VRDATKRPRHLIRNHIGCSGRASGETEVTTIIVTSHGTATPNPYAARIAAEVEAKTVSLAHSLVLKRIMQNPMPKEKSHD
jgi:aromatic ring hydroxylase